MTLKVAELKIVCSAYGISGKLRKRDLVESLLALDLEIDEIKECLEDQERERQDRIRREREEKERAHELELARITRNYIPGNSRNDVSVGCRDYDMSKLIRPFKEGGDLGLFLVNFERVCSQIGFPQDSWSLRLMTVLPPGAAEVIARLGEMEAKSYNCAKDSLLRKYKLNAEAYRVKFRNLDKADEQSYCDFAYKLKANFTEWVKSEKIENGFDKLCQLITLEQFYSKIPEEVKFWVRERNDEKTLEKAADLADEFSSERGVRPENSK